MTVVDHESKENIITPHIAIKDEAGRGSVYINTSTFGYDCQEELVSPLNNEKVKSMRSWLSGERIFHVYAIVGEYNNPLNEIDAPALHTVCLTRPPRLESLLGFLPEKVVKENLPKTYQWFQETVFNKES
ncbi:hypothetical protein GOV14_05830 [Candidatus Pacearchaeota archaeon]|nr:hypothetical protein [Candidatus Pacearchaeota archaeon]